MCLRKLQAPKALFTVNFRMNVAPIINFGNFSIILERTIYENHKKKNQICPNLLEIKIQELAIENY